MNTEKISPELLNNVSVLSKGQPQEIVVSANNFDETKNFLKNFNSIGIMAGASTPRICH